MAYYVGMMSGTSLDGVDAVLADFSGKVPTLRSTHSLPFPPGLREALFALTAPNTNEVERAAVADVELGRLYAQAVAQLLAKAKLPAGQVHAIGCHGQTIRHSPNGPTPYTVQIGDPNTIAYLTGIATVADFRRRDLAAGGQGAPLVPAFHAGVFRSNSINRAVVNIGGIANVTILPADPTQPVGGFDTGPGNMLLDLWSTQQSGEPMDIDGKWAASGTPDDSLLRTLLADPYFEAAPPKSTGREYFHLPWLQARLAGNERAEDVQATLTELTALTIQSAITRHAPHTEEVLVCGGGAYNGFLMSRLAAVLKGCGVVDTSAHGLEPRWVEATAFAWLARQTLSGLPGNLAEVTGASEPQLLGGIYPGRRWPNGN